MWAGTLTTMPSPKGACASIHISFTSSQATLATLYIGVTNSIYRRALQHKAGDIEGFTRKYHCNRLVYYESYEDVHRAIGREKELKGWIRARKIALIESRNPRWADLAEHWGARMRFAGEAIRDQR